MPGCIHFYRQAGRLSYYSLGAKTPTLCGAGCNVLLPPVVGRASRPTESLFECNFA